MASMYQREGMWYVKWFEKGKIYRKSLKTKSKQRARAKLVEIEKALENGTPVGQLKDMEIEAFTEAFHAYAERQKRPYTTKTLCHSWKQFTGWAKPLRLSDVTQETIRNYKEYLLAEEYKKSTVRSSLTALSSVFSKAIKDMGVFAGPNPVRGVGLPKPPKRVISTGEGDGPRFLSKDEISRLLVAAEDHGRDMYMLVALGIFAGLRKNELINARWNWIDFENGLLLVRNKGRFTTKSGHERTIPLAGRLSEILKPHQGVPESFIVYPEQAEKNDDVDSSTKYRVDFTDAFKRVVKKAELTRVTPHVLRHTFASQLVMAGTSLYKVSQWMGHEDLKTTMIYAHLSPVDRDIDNAF